MTTETLKLRIFIKIYYYFALGILLLIKSNLYSGIEILANKNLTILSRLRRCNSKIGTLILLINDILRDINNVQNRYRGQLRQKRESDKFLFTSCVRILNSNRVTRQTYPSSVSPVNVHTDPYLHTTRDREIWRVIKRNSGKKSYNSVNNFYYLVIFEVLSTLKYRKMNILLKMYPCPFCSVNLKLRENLLRHAKLKHKSNIFTECVCRYPSCSHKFNNIYSYERHISKKHDCISQDSTDCTLLSKKKDLAVENIVFTNSESYSSVDDNDNKNATIISSANNELLLNTNEVSVQHFENSVNKSAACLVTKLYSKNQMPRSHVNDLITLFTSFFNNVCLDIIQSTCNNYGIDEDHQISQMIQISKNSFSPFKSEHSSFTYLQELKCLIKPYCIYIDASLKPQRIKKKTQLAIKYTTIHLIANNIDKTKQSTIVTSTCNGEMWNNLIKKEQNKLILPLLLYYDDFEINNPLGSHTGIHKLGAVYCTIPCIPEQYCSMLENIFLIQLHNATDHTRLGNKLIFADIIKQLTELEQNGIDINIDGEKITVYFVLYAVTASLLHITVEYVKHQSDCKQMINDNLVLLRSIENYNEDLMNYSCGVSEECVFNQISNYHVITNASVDPMHALLEEKLFSIDMLNSRLKYFNSSLYTYNCPAFINEKSLRSENLILSASEMNFLVANLGLLIGDLIPRDSKPWSLYLHLREIISIIMAPAFNTETLCYLSNLISRYHAIYLECFNDFLKPKYHILTHYPQIMKQMGPLKNLSCIRFEAKHKQLKDYAKVITSRRNPAYTIALKHQLQLCSRFLSDEGFSDRITIGPISKCTLLKSKDYNSFKSILPILSDEYLITSCVTINGTRYAPNLIVLLNSSSIIPTFGRIQYIICNNQEVFFVVKKLQVVSSVMHYQAFQIIETNN
ncbi:uncharacterized protein [Prorops nasuta]|uniref:uncharacterized protein n=1 Tax=Prorops nasuta TaxID=863751 RepID=UPI0034CE2FD3